MENNFKLSVIVPSYNESGNIKKIFERFCLVIQKQKNIEIVLVDNGSTDDTEEFINRELTQLDSDIRANFNIVKVSENKGYGYGILCGLEKAKGELLSWTHADMQTDPLDLVAALEKYESYNNGKCVVKGARKNRPLLDVFFTWGMQQVSSIALGQSLHDINAQPKLFDREFYENFLQEGSPYDFSLDLYFLYKAKTNGYEILQVPVVFSKRLHGEAKGGGSWKTKFKLMKRTYAYIFELRKYLNV